MRRQRQWPRFFFFAGHASLHGSIHRLLSHMIRTPAFDEVNPIRCRHRTSECERPKVLHNRQMTAAKKTCGCRHSPEPSSLSTPHLLFLSKSLTQTNASPGQRTGNDAEVRPTRPAINNGIISLSGLSDWRSFFHLSCLFLFSTVHLKSCAPVVRSCTSL